MAKPKVLVSEAQKSCRENFSKEEDVATLLKKVDELESVISIFSEIHEKRDHAVVLSKLTCFVIVALSFFNLFLNYMLFKFFVLSLP